MVKPGNCILRHHSAIALCGGGLTSLGLFGPREAAAGRGPRTSDCGTARTRPNDMVGTKGEAMGFGDLGAGRARERAGAGAGIRGLTEGRREKTE